MSRTVRTILIYFAVVAVLWIAFATWFDATNAPEDIDLTRLDVLIADGEVGTVRFFPEANTLEVRGPDTTLEDPAEYELYYPDQYEDELFIDLQEAGVEISTDAEPTTIGQQLINWLPFLFIFGFMFLIFSQMQGGGNRVMQFGKSKAKQMTKDQPKVTFADVAGLEEAIEELEEIKDFLQNPAKYRAMGAKIPRGVLLFGPPGTGKTLLARAVAGEAGVPFFSISGSDFVEMFVGVGASRVRDLFEQAKAQGPAIVFIDEIDAVGRHRGAGMGGGHDEREQTLNQLLVELDGFEAQTGVIVMAATNRPDILDPALLRPGRFDRQITVGRPAFKGRAAILAVHAKGKPLAPDVDLDVIAKQTPGFTGADLANLINEGALLAARHDKKLISTTEIEEAIIRVIAGPERKSLVISDDEKKITAYHEVGHALVGWVLPNADPVHKVTIIPRGSAAGHTQSLPSEDRLYRRRSELIDQLAMALGGRVAEEIVFGDPTTGASNDIEQATKSARQMVMEYGMSDKLGPMKYGQGSGEVFLGRDYGRQPDYSDELAASIDNEVRKLIGQAHEEALTILTTHRDAMERMTNALLEEETLDSKRIGEILADVPKWEHAAGGTMRIQVPAGLPTPPPDGVAASQTDA